MSGDGRHHRDVSAWQDATLVAHLIAIDPVGLGGAVVSAGPGAARDRWLVVLKSAVLPQSPFVLIPSHITQDRLLGGIDLGATLALGRRSLDVGVLPRADGGIAVLAMAERCRPGTAAVIAQVMDDGVVAIERDGFSARRAARFALIALDESQADEAGPSHALCDRLAFHVNLQAVTREDLGAPQVQFGPVALQWARARLAALPPVSTEHLRTLANAASALGIASLRALLLAGRAARASAALCERERVSDEDVLVASRLVLAPRATRVPEVEQAQHETPPPRDQSEAETERVEEMPEGALDDVVLAAAIASLPADVLKLLLSGRAPVKRAASDGRSGMRLRSLRRGTPVGTVAASSAPGARLNILATLTAAVPWQRLRRAAKPSSGAKLLLRPSDFRATRFKQKSSTTVIFAVDASGSSALGRLAEAKGAIEILLSESYARRDHVALLMFRGSAAELVLPPTRALARARRSLAGIPGGGGTPLAIGLDAAADVARGVRSRGGTPSIVALTDGRANVTREGKGGRRAAEADALSAAKNIAQSKFDIMLIDTSPQPSRFAAELAANMNGRCLALPVADAHVLSAAIQRHVALR